MLPAPSIYPRFAANQLLTESSLNQMVDYFDGQVRDTRIYLNGLGIFYGFTLELSEDVDGKCLLTVTKGAGVSSEGFMFKLADDCIFRGYKNEITVLKEKLWKPGCPSEGFKDVYDVFELTEEVSDGAIALTKDVLVDKVVMFLCEFDDRETTTTRERCFNELDEQGVSKTSNLRMLLFSKSDVEGFAKSITSGSAGQNSSLPTLCIQRFGYTAEPIPSIRLANIVDVNAYQNNYTSILNSNIIDDIGNAYKKAGEIYRRLFNEQENVFKNFRTDLVNFRDDVLDQEPSIYSLQYFYDYLKDLISAYEEFACLDTIQQATLFPDTCDFPKYLLLGIPNPSRNVDGIPTATPKDFRTLLQRPPIEDIGAAGVDMLQTLFDRMKKMADFEPNVFLPYSRLQTETRITPSQGINRPLSEQAIPFYLRSGVLRPCWNFGLSSLGKADEIPSYNPASSNKPYGFPLLYDMNKYEFFRVEGHVGKSLGEAKGEIEQLRERWNIPFGIQCVQLDLGDDQPDQKKTTFEFDDIQRLYTKVRADIQCLAKQPNFVNPQLLLGDGQFPEELGEFNYDTFEQTYNQAMSANDNIVDCNLEVLEKLYNENQALKEKYTEMVWFHEFAQKHHGLEHLGGVYKGGTLVLVFIKSFNNKRNVIVGDFCLPYNCCSDSPSVVFKIDEVRPRIIIGNEFCSNDSTKHQIIATPTGSVVTGPGVSSDGNGGFLFTPSATGLNFGGDLEKTITLVSVYQDITVTKEITIHKVPEIQIKAETELSFGDGCVLEGIIYKFSDAKTQAESGTYKWLIEKADGTSEEFTDDVVQDYKINIGENVNISLTGQRGICKGNDSSEFTACPTSISIKFGEVTIGDNTLDPSAPIDNKLFKKLPLIVEPKGGSFELYAVKADGSFEPLDNPAFDTTGDNCDEKQYSINISNLSGKDLIAKPPVSGKYQIIYRFGTCDTLGKLNFAIKKTDDGDNDNPPPPPPIGDEIEGDANPQMRRTPAVRRPRSNSTTKSSAKSSTKPKSKTNDSPASKTTSQDVSEKAKSTPKKKSTTSSSSKKKTSTPKKETTPPKVEKLENGARVMNLRRTAQQSVLKKLEEENKLKGKSFALGMSAFLLPPTDLEQLNQRFEEAMKAVMGSVKRSSKEEVKSSWAQFGETLLHNYLDKRVALSPTSLDDATKDLLRTQVDKMKELKMDVKAIAKNWNGKELEAALKATIIKDINALLK